MNYNKTSVFLLIAIFFVFVLPMIEEKYNKDMEKFSNQIDNYLIKVPNKIDTLKCSRDCCNHTQWPVPHMKKNKNLSTNLMCNHGDGGGCVCMDKDNFDYLSSRGNNA